MNKWGESASAREQEDFDSLLDASVGFAKQLLDTQGEFYPYAAVVDGDGQLGMIGSDIGEEKPESAAVVSSLLGAIRAQRDDVRAYALVAVVQERETGNDAVRVNLEHSDGLNFAVLLPFTTDGLGLENTYGDLRLGKSSAAVWSSN